MSMRSRTAARTTEPAPDPALTILGATTCEDTALVRSRLAALDVPFVELDVDVDPGAAERLARLHDGALVTPTLVMAGPSADAATILTEPTLEQLDKLLADRDLVLSPPAADVTQFHGGTVERAIPIRTLATSRGGTFSVESLRGRRQVALFLGHDATCLACMGYAKQLARQTAALADADAVAIAAIAPTDGPGTFEVWHREIDPDLTILADGGGEWKRSVLSMLGHEGEGTALLMLDRYAAPRAGSFASEAGGLANPSEAAEWLAFVALECPECSTELPWPSDPRS